MTAAASKPPDLLPGNQGWLREGVPLPRYNLTPLQMMAVRLLAQGEKPIDVRKRLAIHPHTMRDWLQHPTFLKAIEDRVEQHETAVEAMLLDGEAKAAAAIVAALDAEKHVFVGYGKRRRLRRLPDHEVRLRAAISLLDRMGQRGKPVERVQAQVQNIDPSNLREQVVKALADPKVRGWLLSNPQIAAELGREIKLVLQAGPPVEGAPPPDGPDVETVPEGAPDDPATAEPPD